MQTGRQSQTMYLQLRRLPGKGLCCDCVSYHLAAGELPGCFSARRQRTYDRSFAQFARLVNAGKL